MGSNKVVLETINVCRICNTNDDDSWYNIEEESIFDHPNVPILEAMTKLIGVDEVNFTKIIGKYYVEMYLFEGFLRRRLYI